MATTKLPSNSRPGHYSLAQASAGREVTGYARTVEVPAGIACSYPHAFTAIDKARVLSASRGMLPACVFEIEAGRVKAKDAAGRVTTFRKVKAGWNWTEASAKGKLSGKVLALAAFDKALARVVKFG